MVEFNWVPYSLYADDMALFLPDSNRLEAVLSAITWVGTYTGLHLNIDKTIAFSPSQAQPINLHRVVIVDKPVKYLGAYLGLGDLTQLNFEKPLMKLQNKIQCWNKRNLSLKA